MKYQKFRTLSFLCLIFVCSCDEPTPIEYNSDAERIIGTWDWIITTGGIANIIETPESTGQNKSLKFDNDENIRYYLNGTNTRSLKFRLGFGMTIFSSDSIPVIFINDTVPTYAYTFSNDNELLLSENFYDGFNHRYKRK